MTKTKQRSISIFASLFRETDSVLHKILLNFTLHDRTMCITLSNAFFENRAHNTANRPTQNFDTMSDYIFVAGKT